VLFKSGDVVTANFAGVIETKRRPVVVLSSDTYHTSRPDVIAGLVTTQTKNLGKTDYILQDWKEIGLRTASIFRSFIITLPPEAKLIYVGHLSERDWSGIRSCVKLAFAKLDDLESQSI
jgi:mRNA interferase MazF